MKPYYRGLFGILGNEELDSAAELLCPENTAPASKEGQMAAEASAAADFKRLRRVKHAKLGAMVSLPSIVAPPKPFFLGLSHGYPFFFSPEFGDFFQGAALGFGNEPRHQNDGQ